MCGEAVEEGITCYNIRYSIILYYTIFHYITLVSEKLDLTSGPSMDPSAEVGRCA